ncbi:hypothetical protein HIM_02368 [Hirsutella minnesotensis 3608]|nr:hypothetical protein HIM_02368 [Hirsutella minnesotensis 3608]
MAALSLPTLPAPHGDLVKHISRHPEQSMVDIMAPYRQYEARLRELYAQDRQNPVLDNHHINLVPVFTQDTKLITARARDLAAETEEEKARYIMPLAGDKRRPHGAPATVSGLAEFQHNFNIFSESSLVEMDWSNVVAAGSSVLNCLLPVPPEFKVSKRKLREYYHEKFCPASDVDLFLYGLTHDEAIAKMKQIEQAVRDAILNEVTVVRTKYAITIASQYPVRHIQIVLRVYKSISEILAGFDIDAAGAAYDGKQVYVTPRALGSVVTQINHIDLSRRSPSYENRLSKYSHRNFEVYWADLDRSRIDPTIFERSFQRTLGLARLLVLERLPTSSAREAYLNRRREERGRPTKSSIRFRLGGNIKDSFEDEVADWALEEDVSNYNTFTVPYGQRFHAKRIEKLCYTRDLLLNAEWNESAHRDVYLHRHPAFFGRVEDIVEDCCGFCPSPATPEEIELAERDAEKYVSGKISFIVDDPGRQQIGSFKPLIDQDWTDMAYVGNTARLCQSIVDQDVEDVLNWLSQPEADPNKRDYTGRTPLHLAVMVSTPEIVKCLIDHGSRLTARLADGRTALHMAAARGHVEIMKILMQKSIENEEAANERLAKRRKLASEADSSSNPTVEAAATNDQAQGEEKSGQGSDSDLMEEESSSDGLYSAATSSYVKVNADEIVIPEDDLTDEPDYFKIDAVAWDMPCSPLHLAIVGGHEEAVELLSDYGADAILPVKFDNTADTAAILTLTLALSLPLERAKSMVRLLLKLGATSSQADANGYTAFQRYVDSGKTDIIDILFEHDRLGVKTSLNHLVFGSQHYWDSSTRSPLRSAIQCGDSVLVLKLLDAGAYSRIDFDTWLKSAKTSSSFSYLDFGNLELSRQRYQLSVEQPFITAIRCGKMGVALQLLERGADPNTLTKESKELLDHEHWRGSREGQAALDVVRNLINKLSSYSGEKPSRLEPPLRPGMDEYLQNLEPGTYKYWLVSANIDFIKKCYKSEISDYQKELKVVEEAQGVSEKKQAINEALSGLRELETALISKGAKPFEELHPDFKMTRQSSGLFSRLPYCSHYGNAGATKPYKFDFQFSNDKDMTEARRDGYIELMEAAWNGDLKGIKSLTLEAFGPEKDQPPLKMAITDNSCNSPFSLAFYRGHQDVARAILEIVGAQWSPPKEEKASYRMRDGDEEDEMDDDDGDEKDSESDPDLVAEKPKQAFTTDDIGKISTQVNSHVKPLEVLCDAAPSFIVEGGFVTRDLGTRSYFVHVLDTDDAPRLRFLLDVVEYFTGKKASDDNAAPGDTFTFPESDFTWALNHGKTRMLGEVIQRLGAGMPLNHLVEKSGIAIKEKPRYYQGLTVYGSKKKNWATAGQTMATGRTELKTPPLLHAALGGSMEAVEFFLSDTPRRLYREFGKSKLAREDKRLKHLNEVSGGFDRAIADWLDADNDLAIHCAVLSKPTAESHSLLEYLVKAYPESMERKTTDGDTPLMLASRLGLTSYCKVLIAAGADQSTRNVRGENIVHAALLGLPMASQLKHLLDLIDPDLRSHLFTQRTILAQNGNTPLHSWISQLCLVTAYGRPYYRDSLPDVDVEAKSSADTLKLILEYAEGKELDLLNGAGETCLHTAIKKDLVYLVKTLVEYKPQLLLREDAVGRTASELAHDRRQSKIFERPQKSSYPRDQRFQQLPEISPTSLSYRAIFKDKSPEELKTIAEAAGLGGDYDAEALAYILNVMGIGVGGQGQAPSHVDLKEVVWDYCSTTLARHPGKRRLVSLNEANDVSRRLGECQAKFSTGGYQQREGGSDADSQGEDDGLAKGDFATRRLESLLSRAWKWSSVEKKVLGVADDG